MEVLRFGVSLEDGVTAAAGAAGASLRGLQTALEKTAKETQGLGKAQSQALAMNAAFDAKADKAAQAMGRMHSAALKMNAAMSATPAHAHELAGGLLHVVEPAEVMRHALEGVGAGLKEMGSSLASGEFKGVVTGASESLAGLASTLDLVIPGLGQVASAAIKAGGAFAAMTVGVVQAGVEMALEVTAVNEKLEATFEALGRQGPESGAKTMKFLNDLATTLPQSRDQLAQWTKQYEAMGVSDLGELRHELQATASAQAIMGESGAAAYQKIDARVRLAVEGHHGLKLAEKSLKSLYEAGVNETDIATKMGMSVQTLSAKLKAGTVDAQAFGNALSSTLVEKGKGPLAAMGSELGTLKVKATETLHHLFDGIDTSPLTDAFQSVIHLGDLGEPSGRAMAGGIKGGLNEIIKGLGELVTEAEIAFLTVELWTVQYGPTAKSVIKGIETGVKGLVAVVEELISPFTAVLDLATAIKRELHGGVGVNVAPALGVGRLGGATSFGSAPEPTSTLTSPAHATGGVVGKPAPGEFWASVAPGEMILPQREARMMSAPALGPSAQAARQEVPAAGTSGGAQVGSITVNVHAAGAVTDAQALSVVGLSVALERLQLAAGR